MDTLLEMTRGLARMPRSLDALDLTRVRGGGTAPPSLTASDDSVEGGLTGTGKTIAAVLLGKPVR